MGVSRQSVIRKSAIFRERHINYPTSLSISPTAETKNTVADQSIARMSPQALLHTQYLANILPYLIHPKHSCMRNASQILLHTQYIPNTLAYSIPRTHSCIFNTSHTSCILNTSHTLLHIQYLAHLLHTQYLAHTLAYSIPRTPLAYSIHRKYLLGKDHYPHKYDAQLRRRIAL